MKRKDEPEFKAQLRRGLIALLTILRNAANAVCRQRALRITNIGLTIPVQWTLEFEEVYRELMLEVFEANHAARCTFSTKLRSRRDIYTDTRPPSSIQMINTTQSSSSIWGSQHGTEASTPQACM